MTTSAMLVGIYGSLRKRSRMPPPMALGRILMATRFAFPIGGLLVMPGMGLLLRTQS